MKPSLRPAIVGISFLSSIGADAIAQTPVPAAPSEEVQLAQDIKEVETRVGMSAPMEAEIINGVDPVAESADLGWLIDVTIDQVEAAVDSAAATPGNDDDIEAMRLKHQGSYRFYSGDAAPEEEPESAPDAGTNAVPETPPEPAPPATSEATPANMPAPQN